MQFRVEIFIVCSTIPKFVEICIKHLLIFQQTNFGFSAFSAFPFFILKLACTTTIISIVITAVENEKLPCYNHHLFLFIAATTTKALLLDEEAKGYAFISCATASGSGNCFVVTNEK